MNISRVIITKQKKIVNHYSFENEIGLSSYDVALISINKMAKKSNLNAKDFSNTTYLI